MQFFILFKFKAKNKYPEIQLCMVGPDKDGTLTKCKHIAKQYKIAKNTFAAIDKKKWKTALKITRKAKDKNLHNLVNYLY